MALNKLQYAQRKAAHLCVTCGKSAPTGIRCKPCAQYQYDYYTRRRIERASVGECTQCSKPHVGQFLMCAGCRETTRGYYHKAGNQTKVSTKRFRTELKMAAYAAYGGAFCNCCGETEISFLSIDHMNNDGTRHRKEAGIVSGTGLHRWLKQNKYPSGFQVLCLNCNKGRFLNNGICPHKSHAMAMFNNLSNLTVQVQ